MPKILCKINLENFHFGDQGYGAFDWGFDFLRISFGAITKLLNLCFQSKTAIIKFRINQLFQLKNIQIRAGPNS